MPVISGGGAQELHRPLTAPGLLPAYPFGIGGGDVIEHHVEAGIAADDDVFRRHPHHRAEQGPRLRNAVGDAVVAGIRPARGAVAIPRVHTVEHIEGQVKLLGTRFAAGHIELQPPGLIGFVSRLAFRLDGFERGLFEFLPCRHE